MSQRTPARTLVASFGIVFSLIFASAGAADPRGWIWVNPLPQGNTLFAVAPLSDRDAWAGGGAGSLLDLDGGGQTATFNNTTNVYKAFSDVSFIGASDGWFLADDTIFRSKDGGVTWADSNLMSPSPRLHQVRVLDSNTAFVSARKGFFFRTTDGAATWDGLAGASLAGNDCDGLDFIDKDNGWLSCTGMLMATTDAGATFRQITRDPALGNCRGLVFIDGNDGWASNFGGTIFRTRDGGRSWTATKVGVGNFWGLFVARHSEGSIRGWAVGEQGQIFTTTDGDRWTRQSSPTAHILRDVEFLPDLRTGWIVGEKGTILTTTDGGARWILRKRSAVPSEPMLTPRLNGIAVTADEKVEYAVGERGIIVKSNDGGATWTPQFSGVIANLNSVFVHPTRPELAWAVGDERTTLWTADGGMNWFPVLVGPPNTRVMDVHFLTDLRGVAVGHEFTQDGKRFGRIWTTLDGGRTWVPFVDDAIPPQGPFPFPIEALNGVHLDNTGHGAAVGVKGSIYLTSDGGFSWRRPVSIGTTTRDLNGVYLRSDGARGWAVGDDGTILATIDRGLHWSVVQTGLRYNLRSVAFREDVVEGLAVGDRLYMEIWDGSTMAAVLKFDGTKWSAQRSRTQFPLARVRYLDTNHAWVAGDEGSILRTANGGEE